MPLWSQRNKSLPAAIGSGVKILILFAVPLIIILAQCTGNNGETNPEKSVSPENLLKGTLWSSDFYHYHNNYYFITDSTGYWQQGQYLWSTPVDPALYNNSRDSIAYNDNSPFKYTLRDTVLTFLDINDTTGQKGKSVFYLSPVKNGKPIFVSAEMYAYGSEILHFKKEL